MIPKFRFWDKGYKIWLTPDSVWLDDEGSFRGVDGVNRFEPIGQDLIVMQSTGLFDKNGKEIFEGDIVVNKYGNVGYVAYLQQEAGFVVVLKKSDYRLGHRNTGESYDVATNHEIIGNIYQNPESVEG